MVLFPDVSSFQGAQAWQQTVMVKEDVQFPADVCRGWVYLAGWQAALQAASWRKVHGGWRLENARR